MNSHLQSLKELGHLYHIITLELFVVHKLCWTQGWLMYRMYVRMHIKHTNQRWSWNNTSTKPPARRNKLKHTSWILSGTHCTCLFTEGKKGSQVTLFLTWWTWTRCQGGPAAEEATVSTCKTWSMQVLHVSKDVRRLGMELHFEAQHSTASFNRPFGGFSGLGY